MIEERKVLCPQCGCLAELREYIIMTFDDIPEFNPKPDDEVYFPIDSGIRDIISEKRCQACGWEISSEGRND